MDLQATRRCAVVVEDDADIAALIEIALKGQGFEVTVVADGAAGIEAVAAIDPDLVTLDVGLPGIDGVEVCRRIRPTTDAYIIMVTALNEEIDRLIALETGADDYLAKPISTRELKVRVNALFRRPRRIVAYAEASPPVPLETTGRLAGRHAAAPDLPLEPAPARHQVLRHGDLVLDVDGYRVHRGDDEVTLTPTEFSLLATMMRAPQRVWTREALLAEVWGAGWEAETHLAEVHVGNLRRKLGDRRGRPRYLETVRGVGYRMLQAD
ncbi:response regulator transcription factor [Nocardioides pantholopis]|uniref:response regulator transcription factor n=1 Tax=Nocardioides pantholopis TaxID=2483798 RepID=UPI000F096251|nr:response regulator transcription factor [Nocardioides pantholopis]